MCAMAQKHLRAPRKRRTSENSVCANFRECPECELRLNGVLRSSEHRGGPGPLLPKPRPPTLVFSVLVSQLLRCVLRRLAWYLHFRCRRVIFWLAALQSVQPRLKVGARRHGGISAVVGVGQLVGISARGRRRAKIIEFAEASFVLNVLTGARTDRVVVNVNGNLLVCTVFTTLNQDGRPPSCCAPREDRNQRTPIDVGGRLCLCPRQLHKGRQVVGV